MSEQVDSKISDSQSIFKVLVWDTEMNVVLSALFANPNTAWMGIWPFRPLITALVSLIGNAIYEKTTLYVDIGAIKFLNDKQQKAFDEATTKLAVIAHDKGTDSDEFKQAREQAKIDMSNFTRINK